MNAITAKAILGELLGAYDECEHGDYFYDHGDEVCDAVDCILGEPRWISVEERMPEIEMHGTSRVVLAWESEHGRCFAMVYDNGQGKRWFSGGVEIPNITHWMPLPEPPTEVVSDGD